MFERSTQTGTKLFARGVLSHEMYVVSSGCLRYSRLGHLHICQPNTWLCEAVLWMKDWHTRGTARVSLSAELVALNAEEFRKIFAAMDLGSKSKAIICEYALLFLSETFEDQDPMLRHTDVWTDASHVEFILRKQKLVDLETILSLRPEASDSSYRRHSIRDTHFSWQ